MKKRLDILALEQGLETTRERVQALIMSGQIYVNNTNHTAVTNSPNMLERVR